MNLAQFKLIRTNPSHPGYKTLIPMLDAELTIRDGREAAHAFYQQYNKSDTIKHVVMAYYDNEPVGCGAIKAYENDVAELKRMFVPVAYRGRGIAGTVLKELENWAAELGFSTLILETGKGMPEAIGLYQKNGFEIIPNYGQYVGKQMSVCMKKVVSSE